ncbi:MAG: tetratricopeptide repeat protein [Chitinophagales bacterium]|nr:tetratricopeptide repeat protein [Chitinophagales bacterium]
MAENIKDQNISLEDRLTNFEHWVNENRQLLTVIIGGIVLIVAGFLAFTKLYLGPKNIEANNQMFMAEKYFGQDSLNLALKGDGNYLGFQQIMDDYKWTDAANLAHYYTGIIYLKQNKFQDAIDQLKAFNGKDKMVTSMALGALGDAYSETGKADDAVDYYKKAAYHFESDLTTPLFLKKAGMLLENQKKMGDAKNIYQEIKSKYPNSVEGRDMDKYIARIEAAS